jgi:hypothetical protein
MKQTAVEWLLKQLTIANFEEQRIVIQQAKEMEKQQIIDAYWDGGSNWDSEKEAEQYYNETFKNQLQG